MINRRRRNRLKKDVELDITSFMNLMVILVPVLLLGMVFSQVRILNLQLPVSANEESSQEDESKKVLELVINEQGFHLNYPEGVLLKNFVKQNEAYDFSMLSVYLQDLKLTFQQKKIDKNDIVILLTPSVDYQTLVSAMDTVRSFKAVVAANLVDAELFPLISLGDAPISSNASTSTIVPTSESVVNTSKGGS